MCRTAKTNDITSAKLHGKQNLKCETQKRLESLLYKVTRTRNIITQQVLKHFFGQIFFKLRENVYNAKMEFHFFFLMKTNKDIHS
jgi:hypothetical protein